MSTQLLSCANIQQFQLHAIYLCNCIPTYTSCVCVRTVYRSIPISPGRMWSNPLLYKLYVNVECNPFILDAMRISLKQCSYLASILDCPCLKST